MNLKATKTPLLIAAIATAFTMTGLGQASAKSYWASATTDASAAQVIDANFKVKLKKHKHFRTHKHHGHKHHAHKHHGHKFHGSPYHGVKKKSHVSPKAAIKKKLLLKKLF